MKQGDAVFGIIVGVVGEINGKVELTESQRDEVHAKVCEGFLSRKIDFADTPSNREKLASKTKLSQYVSGLISNWLRKDPRLNGGEKYTPKNPGSRTGAGDEQMKTLKALQKQFAGTDKEAKILASIEKRKAELAAEKFEEVDVSVLPDEVREAIGL